MHYNSHNVSTSRHFNYIFHLSSLGFSDLCQNAFFTQNTVFISEQVLIDHFRQRNQNLQKSYKSKNQLGLSIKKYNIINTFLFYFLNSNNKRWQWSSGSQKVLRNLWNSVLILHPHI